MNYNAPSSNKFKDKDKNKSTLEKGLIKFMKAYQLKIAIKNSKPLIWRRCVVPAGITFSQLGILINEVMGWSGYHLFEFEFYHLNITILEEDEEDFLYYGNEFAEASTTYIDEFMESQDWFTYIYDFGDDWQHRVTIEEVISNYEYNYPQVLKYKGPCLIEDCGGIYGYYECMEIMEDENHAEYDERAEWLELQCYEKEYDIESVNEKLKANYCVTYGKGETRLQGEIYKSMFEGKKGLTVSKSAENNNSIRNDRYTADNLVKQFENRMKSINLQDLNYMEELRNSEQDTLEEIFQCYGKQDLIEIARIHEMKRYSKYNKDELVSYVINYILRPEEVQRYFLNLRDNEIEEFERAIKQGNPYRSKQISAFDRILDGGYGALTVDDRLVIPMNVAEVYHNIRTPEFSKARKIRSHLLDCFNAAKVLYGVAPISIIAKMYNQNLTSSMEHELMDTTSIIAEYEGMSKDTLDFVIYDNQYIDKSLLINGLYKDLKSCQGNKDFYMPSKEEIQDLAIEGYFSKQGSLKNLMEFFINRLGVGKDFAKGMSAEIQKIISMNCRMQDIFDLMEENHIHISNDAQLNEVVLIINVIWNDTRMVINRGFKPDELSMARSKGSRLNRVIKEKSQDTKIINFPTVKNAKVYPNDPCPCGSGKKYKQCCGKKTVD